MTEFSDCNWRMRCGNLALRAMAADDREMFLYQPAVLVRRIPIEYNILKQVDVTPIFRIVYLYLNEDTNRYMLVTHGNPMVTPRDTC